MSQSEDVLNLLADFVEHQNWFKRRWLDAVKKADGIDGGWKGRADAVERAAWGGKPIPARTDPATVYDNTGWKERMNRLLELADQLAGIADQWEFDNKPLIQVATGNAGTPFMEKPMPELDVLLEQMAKRAENKAGPGDGQASAVENEVVKPIWEFAEGVELTNYPDQFGRNAITDKQGESSDLSPSEYARTPAGQQELRKHRKARIGSVFKNMKWEGLEGQYTRVQYGVTRFITRLSVPMGVEWQRYAEKLNADIVTWADEGEAMLGLSNASGICPADDDAVNQWQAKAHPLVEKARTLGIESAKWRAEHPQASTPQPSAGGGPAMKAEQPGGGMDHATVAVGEPSDALLSSVQLAEKYGLEPEKTRKILDRYRKKNHSGWTEVEKAKPNEPHFLYIHKAVHHILDAAQHKAEVRNIRRTKTSGQRPAGKNFLQ